MKENSKKSLLLLYSPDKNQKVLAEVSQITAVMSDLQPGGQRAMVAWWQKQGWIESIPMEKGRLLALTSLGAANLEQELPYFQTPADWQGEWELLILRSAPKVDPAFQNLRSLLKRQGGMQVTRGVYAFISQIPAGITQLCYTKYPQSVTFLKVDSHSSQPLNDLAVQFFQLYEEINAYSSISRELDGLLIENKHQKRLINSIKNTKHSLYSRFFATFCEDNGLLLKLVPAAPKPLQILSRIQQLLLL